MSKISGGIAAAKGGCAKPGCTARTAIQRHHKAHEALWLGVWAHRGREPQFRAFRDRYHHFFEEDIVRVCDRHHAEIHSIYDGLIKEDLAKTGMPLYLYSWKQARILMRQLVGACELWLVSTTPGLDPEIYEQTKALRRSILKKQSARKHPAKPGQEAVAKKRGRKHRKRRRSKS